MMTTARARQLIGSYYRIAILCGIHRSSVGRWGKYVPQRHLKTIIEAAYHA